MYLLNGVAETNSLRLDKCVASVDVLIRAVVIREQI